MDLESDYKDLERYNLTYTGIRPGVTGPTQNIRGSFWVSGTAAS
jgi:hypothetical protein